MVEIILMILTLLIGTLDDFKWFIQYKKIQRTNKTQALSKRVLIISIFSKSWVFGYSLYKGQFLYTFLYGIGVIGTWMVLYTVYKISRLKNKSPIKFIKRAFHLI